MLVIKNLNSGVIQRSTLLTDYEKVLLQKLIDGRFDFTNWFCSAEPGLGDACRKPGNNEVDFSDNYWGRIFNVTKQYFTNQGRSFEQMMANELNNIGIKVTTSNDVSNAIVNALAQDEDYKEPLAQLLYSMDLGTMRDEINSMLLSSSNKKNLLQAIEELHYVIPTVTDANGVADIKQLYWGMYYLKNYSVPSILSTNCGQINETLSQLNFEQAQIKRNELDQQYAIYSQQDWDLRQQVVSDIYTKFSGLYARLNCTATQAAGSSNVIKWSLIGVGVLFGFLILKKLLAKKAA